MKEWKLFLPTIFMILMARMYELMRLREKWGYLEYFFEHIPTTYLFEIQNKKSHGLKHRMFYSIPRDVF